MATSSITKNFVISGREQVEMFLNAVESSANAKVPHIEVNVTFLEGADNIAKFMEKRKNPMTYSQCMQEQREKGADAKLREIIEKMLKRMSIDEVSFITELSVSEIKAITENTK